MNQVTNPTIYLRVPSERYRSNSYAVLLQQFAISLCVIVTLAQWAVGQNTDEDADLIDPISVRLAEAPSDHWVAGVRDLQRKDFFERWRKLGSLYSNSEDPLIQDLKFIGRFHYQYGLVDGSVGGNDVNYETDEMRRFRTGLSTKFL